MYHSWKQAAKEGLKIYAAELCGRGRKMIEPLSGSIREEAAAILQDIRPLIDKIPYAIFGHSMGSLLAYELYYMIEAEGLPLPGHMFFSGGVPPQILSEVTLASHLWPDTMLLEHCKMLGGISQEVLENKSILEYFLPILRNDYRLLNTYQFEEGRKAIVSNVSVYRGETDTIEPAQSRRWKELVNGGFDLTEFAGNHFYLLDESNHVLDHIYARLMK